MPRKPKFMRGNRVRNIHELIEALDAHKWLYWNDKPKHWNVLPNMSLATLRGAIMCGNIRYAIPYTEPVDSDFDSDFSEIGGSQCQ